jgi:diguanylate cyclase (GGDEF)-like protein
MSQAGQGILLKPAPEALHQRIEGLDWRDFQLWGIGALVLLVLALGFLGLVMPQLLWKSGAAAAVQYDLPQLLAGLLVIVVLLNIYLFQQRRVLLKTRLQLVEQLQLAERTARTDALTSVFNGCFLQEALIREVARAERNGSMLTVMLADVDGFRSLNARCGPAAADELLVEVAALLRNNSRAADLVARLGNDEFVVLMPETSLEQAGIAVNRFSQRIEKWNMLNDRAYSLSVACGVATHLPGGSPEELLAAAQADLRVTQRSSVPGADHASFRS